MNVVQKLPLSDCPPTANHHQTSTFENTFESIDRGEYRSRTDDLLNANQAL